MARVAASAGRSPKALAQRFKQRILKDYCVRFHMSLIVMAVVASGVLSSKLMLVAGVRSLWLRYPVAVLCAYGVFLGLVRLWIAYVLVRRRAAEAGVAAIATGGGSERGDGDAGSRSRGRLLDAVDLDLSGAGSGGEGGSVSFGGGDSGGGGASDSWGMAASEMQAPGDAGSGGGWLPDLKLDLDLGDDGWWILLVLLLLAIVIFCAGGYLVWAAPDILSEAAWQALLGGVLVRARRHTRAGWMGGVLRSTAIPFTIVLIVAAALGWQAHRHCPQASRLAEALACAAE